MRAKIFIVNGTPRIRPREVSPPATSVPGMSIGAWGDPHMTIRVLGLNPSNPLISTNVAKWGDNKDGPSGNNELLLVDLQTSTDTIRVFYTNKNWTNGAKVVDNVRVVYNGVSTSYTDTTRLVRGPVTIRIVRHSSGASRRLDFEISWQRINNVIKFGGAVVPILKRVATNNGREWNGGDGVRWDGFGRALAAYGLTRSSFETGFGIQSLSEELQLLSDESNFLESMIENAFVKENNVFDGLENLGENGEGDGTPVEVWDDTYTATAAVFSSPSGLAGYVEASISEVPIITITSQPSNQVAISGNATFSVGATVTQGAALSYQWQKQESGSGSFGNIGGATSSSLALSGLTNANDNNDVYRVILDAADNAQSVTSSTATLTVNASDPTLASNLLTVAANPPDSCSNTVTFTWNAPTVTEIVRDGTPYGIAYHRIQLRDADGTAAWHNYEQSINPNGPLQYVFTSATNNKTYSFRIRIQYLNDEFGLYTEYSNEVTTLPGSTAPFMVGMVFGAYDPETGNGNGVGDGVVYLQWAPASECGGGYVVRHRIEYTTVDPATNSAGGPWTVFAADSSEANAGGTPKIAITGLTNGTTIWVRVAGIGPLGPGAYGLSGPFTPSI